MESPEVDIKPTIPTDDIPDKSLLTVGVSRLKQSRYEDVWPEDVHAAFMEAVALYPPMGKRRLKYYPISTHENKHFPDTNRAKSFGRCQLIQSYILEKTGKNRSRKQVSSHLQRLKKIHKDNPTMRPLFSEHFCFPMDHSHRASSPILSQDVFAINAFSTRHFKSDFDPPANVQNVDTGADDSPTFPYASEMTSFYGGSCNTLDFSTSLHNKPSVTPFQELISPRQSPTSTFHPSDSDFLSELQNPLLSKDAINGGFRAESTFNTSAFPISMRRLASRLPLQGRVDSYSTTHLSRADDTPGLHQWNSYDGLMESIPSAPPLTPARQWLHMPYHPPHLIPTERQRLDPVVASNWVWAQNSDIGLGSRDGDFPEISTCYPLTVYRPDSTLLEMGVNLPVFRNPRSGNEGSQFSQGITYSYMATSPGIVSGVPESATNVTGQVSPENFVPPPVIRPTPIYPVSYIHSDDPHMSTSNNLLLP